MRLNPVERAKKKNWKPRNAVWELTLACNLRCDHCGSRAGVKLADELDTAECLALVGALHALGTELITLSGGEPTLRGDWDVIAREIHRRGMLVNMVTNGVFGRHTSAKEVATRALDAGMCNVGVSIDGPLPVHNRIRGNGTFEKTTESITTFRKMGLLTTVMCTVNRLNIVHLEQLREIAVSLGARALRFQLAKPMGTMDAHRDWVMPSSAIPLLLQRLARMKQQGGIDIRVGDSLGYYGKPDRILRHRSWNNKKTRWGGCQAGMQAIGIQANGDIKGCLSLQAARGEQDPFVEGNIRETPLAALWYREGAFAYNRDFAIETLTHDCKACKQAALCRGGARCISTAMDGTLSHDDYCYYRQMSESERQDWVKWSRSAAAAAALAAAVGASACNDAHRVPPPEYGVDYYDTDTVDAGGDTENGTEKASDANTDTDTRAADTVNLLDTDTVTPDTGDTDRDTAVLEYAVEPVDTETDIYAPEYAVEPDYAVMPDYAVEPEPED